MPFIDVPIEAGRIGKTVSGLAVSQRSAMELEVASGQVELHESGETCQLGQSQVHQFSAHATLWTRVFIGLISNGPNTDVWVDAYADDGTTTQAEVPTGYRLVHELAWFGVAPAATDILSGDVFRRTVT
jgi:hypothetical protein